MGKNWLELLQGARNQVVYDLGVPHLLRYEKRFI